MCVISGIAVVIAFVEYISQLVTQGAVLDARGAGQYLVVIQPVVAMSDQQQRHLVARAMRVIDVKAIIVRNFDTVAGHTRPVIFGIGHANTVVPAIVKRPARYHGKVIHSQRQGGPDQQVVIGQVSLYIVGVPVMSITGVIMVHPVISSGYRGGCRQVARRKQIGNAIGSLYDRVGVTISGRLQRDGRRIILVIRIDNNCAAESNLYHDTQNMFLAVVVGIGRPGIKWP